MISVPRPILDALAAAARAAAPVEACGLLAGRAGRVERFFPMTNADASPEHFTMRPEEQFAAVRAMRAEGLEMVAIWHSHPATPARLSAEDLRLAFTPGVAYAITSLAGAEPDLRAYRVEGAAAVPVEVEIAA